MSTARSRVAGLLLAVAIASCGGSRTELVLTVRSDILGVDRFEVDARRGEENERMAVAELRDGERSARLTLRYDGGDLGPLALVLRALRAGEAVVTTERVVAFVDGERLALTVALDQDCIGVSCRPGRTCSEGRCRDPLVSPCEYTMSCSADAGPGPDEGPRCGGVADGCPLPEVVLPGDRVALCPAEDFVVELAYRAREGEPPVPLRVADPPAFVAESVGAYLVEARSLRVPGCTVDATIAVATLVEVGGGQPLEVRDLAARSDGAFAATDSGPFALSSPAGWSDLRAGATGELAPLDLAAVAVHGPDPVFGPRDPTGAVYRIATELPFAESAHASLPVPLEISSTEVRALAVAEPEGALLVAAVGGVLVLDGSALRVLEGGEGLDIGEDGLVALGRAEAPTRGGVWVAAGGEIRNLAVGASTQPINGGEPLPAPETLGALRAAVLDDDGGPEGRLWLCAEQAVGLYVLDAAFVEAPDLTRPTVRYTGGCRDLVLDEEGSVWLVATGGGHGLVRLDRHAVPIGSLAAPVALHHVALGRARERTLWAVPAAGSAYRWATRGSSGP
ncbi:MAG: hypothetical protein ACFCGT_01675 [Sandaracinaceae bacterium]